MTFDDRLAVIALANFAAMSAAVSAIVLIGWKRRFPAPAAAATLWRLRLMPLVVSVATSTLIAAAFVRFEPREPGERTGVVLLALAAVAAGLLAASCFRFARFHLRTRRIVRAWMTAAEPIQIDGISIPAYVVTSAFPIVAVVGVFRPRLLLARSVLDRCSPEEMAAIVAHEQAHVSGHDNARRAILASMPDVLSLVPAGRRLIERWHDAIEEAADDDAARAGRDSRLHLAEALIRVARMAPPGRAMADLPASALYRGERIERRVRRLLDPAAAAPVAPPRTPWALAAIALATTGVIALESIHTWMEAAVAFLP